MRLSYTGMTAAVLLLWTGWQVGEVSARQIGGETNAPPSFWSVASPAGRGGRPNPLSTKTMVSINHGALSSALAAAALAEDPSAFSFESVLGQTLVCGLAPSLVMAPELQAKYPKLLALIGSCVDQNGVNGGTVSVVLNTDLEDPKAEGSLSVTFFTKNRWVYVDRDDEDTESASARRVPGEANPIMYSMMLRRDLPGVDDAWSELPPIDPRLLDQAQGNNRRVRGLEDHARNLQDSDAAYVFRFAVATTKEYAAAIGAATTADVITQVVSVMMRINGIYLRELGVLFQLIGNNGDLVCLAGDTDCAAWIDGTGVLDQATTVDGVNFLGPAGLIAQKGVAYADYDLGHAFTTGNRGTAYLGVLCETPGGFGCADGVICGWKARAISGANNPDGEGFIGLLAHEIGHQLDGLHSFRDCAGPNSDNADPAAAAEAGSGTTIMSYAGICPGTNVQASRDYYFHGINIVRMRNHIEEQVGKFACGTTVSPLPNPKPDMETLLAYTVPKGNYVQLGGRVSNPTGGAIFYEWDRVDTNIEEYRLTNGRVPRFRSHEPTTRSALRFLPNLYLLSFDLVDEAGQLEELPPQAGVLGDKVMMFRFIGRTMYDPAATNIPANIPLNAALAGQFGWVDLELTYDADDAPLLFTTTINSLEGGVASTLTWDGGTDNTVNVEILIAINTMEGKGLGYDYDTDVDDLVWVSMGEFLNADKMATVTVPTLSGTTAVLMIRSINPTDSTNTDVYFFDLAPNFAYITGATSEPPSSPPSFSQAPSTSPSGQPSRLPSLSPSDIPSLSPSDVPSQLPSVSPSDVPSQLPSASPSDVPSQVPSLSPSDVPSLSPSDVPSQVPSLSPSEFPSLSPSAVPSELPSLSPSEIPSLVPSSPPSVSAQPSSETSAPSGSQAPSSTPSFSQAPSSTPSSQPSGLPSLSPSDVPSLSPSDVPSQLPSNVPSLLPSDVPSLSPSDVPSSSPSDVPSQLPSDLPSQLPSDLPSLSPSVSVGPSSESSAPSGSQAPSSTPSFSQAPSSTPSSQPSGLPSLSPSDVPSLSPSDVPSQLPSDLPSQLPSDAPSLSSMPSEVPSSGPSTKPSSMPSEVPTTTPSSMPSDEPTTSAMPSSISIVCPVESKAKGRGRGVDEDEVEAEDEPELPVCVVKTTKGRAPRTIVTTVCGMDGKGKGTSEEAFTEGCCDPTEEGDSYPNFCRGPPLCEGQQTPCTSGGKGKSRGRGRPIRGQTDGGRLLRTRGSGKKSNALDNTIAICEGEETLCIGDYDLDYYGTDPQCGPCLL